MLRLEKVRTALEVSLSIDALPRARASSRDTTSHKTTWALSFASDNFTFVVSSAGTTVERAAFAVAFRVRISADAGGRVIADRIGRVAILNRESVVNKYVCARYYLAREVARVAVFARG